MWYTSGVKNLIISFVSQCQQITGKIITYSNFNLDFYHIPTTILFLSQTLCCWKKIINKVGQNVVFILIPLFIIHHIITTMHTYTVFTFSIVVYISTTIFTLNSHYTLPKNGKSSCFSINTYHFKQLYPYKQNNWTYRFLAMYSVDSM